jgi:hypothetical protein
MCEEMRSVFLVCARLRSAQRINGLPQGQKPEGIYVMDANVPSEFLQDIGLIAATLLSERAV